MKKNPFPKILAQSCCWLLLICSNQLIDVQAASAPGAQQIKGELEGIPMHQIEVSTRPHAEVKIALDGRVDEAIWQEIPAFDNMIVAVPGTGAKGEYATQIRWLATDKGMYVSAVMMQPVDTLVRRLTPRDQFIDRDTFGVTLDTSGEGQFAYWFIVALGDPVMDGKVLPERRYTNDWDGPWIGKSAEFSDGWSVEMYLPWAMMNLPESDAVRSIGFAASRQVSGQNQRYQWPGHSYSSSRFVTALNTMTLEGVEPRQRWSVIPFASGTLDSARDENDLRVGMDVSWQPLPLLGVNATLNPDFGAVEADDVVLNLTALETFFPEKRLFFLEGSEVFETTPRANSGNSFREVTNENFATTSRRVFVRDFLPAPISLLNTRRIGGTANQVAVPAGQSVNRGERDQPTNLLGAVKLTGGQGGFRYGALSAFEDDVAWFGSDTDGASAVITDSGRDFSVLRLLYEQSENDRFGVGYLGTRVAGSQYDAEVHGIDLHYGKKSGAFGADLQLLESEVRGVSGRGAVLDVRFAPSAALQHKFEYEYFDGNVDINDLGFLLRNNYRGGQYILGYANPKPGRWFRSTRGTVVVRHQENLSDGQVVDQGVYWRNTLVLSGRNTVRTGLGYLPERFDDRNSRGNGAYKTVDRIWWDMLWATDASRPISLSFGFGGLQEDLGEWTRKFLIGMTARLSDSLYFDLDVSYKRRRGWIVYQGGRSFGAFDAVDLQPSFDLNWLIAANHQIKLSFQWAGVKAYEQTRFSVPLNDGALQSVVQEQVQGNDFTVSLLTTQLRYRWEIAPLTDFYVVYNRGNQLPPTESDHFSDLLSDAFKDPIINSLVVKLRYRFGS
ncbi:MAG: DUF5916 domain-containing protein [Pseudomonadales bacterium]